MDHPSLFEQWPGGLRVREFLNVQFPKTLQRRADLIALIEDGGIFHFEIQSQNDMEIGFRLAMYCLPIAHQFGRPHIQLVLYVGRETWPWRCSRKAGPIGWRRSHKGSQC